MAQVHNSLRKQRRQLEKEAASFARQAERLEEEAGFNRLRRCRSPASSFRASAEVYVTYRLNICKQAVFQPVPWLPCV